MHFSCVLITKEFPTDKVIGEKLRPYNEELYFNSEEDDRPNSTLVWDWWQVGGRYSGLLKLSMKVNNEKYKWEYTPQVPRNGRFFRSGALDDLKDMYDKGSSLLHLYGYEEERFFCYMGARDGFLYVDGGFVDDMIFGPESLGYYLIDKDENVYSRDDGNDLYNEQYHKVMSESSGCYICIVDLHD